MPVTKYTTSTRERPDSPETLRSWPSVRRHSAPAYEQVAAEERVDAHAAYIARYTPEERAEHEATARRVAKMLHPDTVRRNELYLQELRASQLQLAIEIGMASHRRGAPRTFAEGFKEGFRNARPLFIFWD
jgi:hypothetical protein